MDLRSPELRKVAQSLAELASIRVRKGEVLNVRRREDVRRSVAEAGVLMRWSDVAGMSEDPVTVAAEDMKKVLKSGLHALKRQLAEEVTEKQAETERLEKVLQAVQSMADDPGVAYPAEIVFCRTANSGQGGLVTKTETLVVADPSEAQKAAERVQRSLPKWDELRKQMLGELSTKADHLGVVGKSLSGLVESWRGLLREVIATM